MNLEQLELFVEAANEESFDKVAQQNFTTQRTISRKIKNLEIEIGVKLFDRHSNRISLTPAGEIFKIRVQDYLFSMHNTISNLQKLQENSVYTLHIGYFSMFDGVLMRDQILNYKQIKNALPIHFTSTEENIEQILSDLTLGNLDIGYINEYGSYKFINRKLFNFISIYKNKMRLGISKLNPLSKKEIITESDLIGQTLLFYNADKTNYFTETFYSTLRHQFNDYHIKDYYSFEQTLFDTSLNVGITYMPYGLVQKFFAGDSNIVWKDLDSEKMNQDYDMKLIYRKDNKSKELHSFIKSIS